MGVIISATCPLKLIKTNTVVYFVNWWYQKVLLLCLKYTMKSMQVCAGDLAVINLVILICNEFNMALQNSCSHPTPYPTLPSSVHQICQVFQVTFKFPGLLISWQKRICDRSEIASFCSFSESSSWYAGPFKLINFSDSHSAKLDKPPAALPPGFISLWARRKSKLAGFKLPTPCWNAKQEPPLEMFALFSLYFSLIRELLSFLHQFLYLLKLTKMKLAQNIYRIFV